MKMDHQEGVVSQYVVDRELAWGFNGRSYFCCSECLPLFKRFGHALKKICDDPELQKKYGVDIYDPEFDLIGWLLKQWKREQNHTRAFTWTDDLGRKRRFINSPISQDFRPKSPGRWSNMYRSNKTSDVLLDPDRDSSSLSEEALRFMMEDRARVDQASGISDAARGVDPEQRMRQLLQLRDLGLVSNQTVFNQLNLNSEQPQHRTATEIMILQRQAETRIRHMQRQYEEGCMDQARRQIEAYQRHAQNDMANSLRYSFYLPNDSGVKFIPLRASKSEVAARHRKTIVGDDAEADEIGDFLSQSLEDSDE